LTGVLGRTEASAEPVQPLERQPPEQQQHVRRSGWLPAEPDGPDGPRDGTDPASDYRSGEPGRVGTARAAFHTVVPSGLRRGRWAIPWRAAAAAVVLAGLVAVAIAVRTADAAPVQQVPPRGAQVTVSAPADAAPADAAPVDPTAPLVVAGSVAGRSAAGADGAGAMTPADGAALAEAAGAGQAAAVVVHVVGQVATPGLVRVPTGSRVADALAGAGGATAEADLSRVNLARLVVDGEQVVVPRPGEPVTVPPVAPTVGSAGATGAAPDGPVDLNTADEAALDALPGIGEVLAGRIIAWRAERGPFTSVEELGEVSGIGDALLGSLAPLVTV